jgi:acetyltransferase-like isoleucine patch superfamily enzyme
VNFFKLFNMKAMDEIGFKKAFKFFWGTLVYLGFRGLIFPPLRVWYLRLFGAKIGKGCVFHSIRFFNYYRAGFSALKVGDHCFLGNEVLLDLAGEITLGNHVTLSERSVILTHLNVGYKDHPLQNSFPSRCRPVVIEDGSFVGVNAIILDGVTLGVHSFIAAASVVNESIPKESLAGGTPAKVIRKIETQK